MKAVGARWVAALVVGSWASTAGAEAPAAVDRAVNMVDSLVLTKLADMHAVRSASLAESPWSSDRWPLYKGAAACRYSDPAAKYTDSWKLNTDALRSTSPADPDDLSPARKYDLLVGDAAQTLTNVNLNAGKPYDQTNGAVAPWMDLSHGWAPASFMVPRPLKAVVVPAADGVTPVRFFPEDIKALAAALWANTGPKTRFIGSRCNTSNPATDGLGRPAESACRDTNAGTWHLAVVNQIGKARRSFVIDVDPGHEVENQPVYSYSYEYFNPKTNQSQKTLIAAKVAVAEFPEDKFKALRAAGTTHIVGIAMNVRWTVGKPATHAAPDSPAKDALAGARYLYTLELDAGGGIIGGEWLQLARPDFMWTAPPGTTASAPHESAATGTWTGQTAVPAAWRSAAAQSSTTGAPLDAIVRKLVELSRQ